VEVLGGGWTLLSEVLLTEYLSAIIGWLQGGQRQRKLC